MMSQLSSKKISYLLTATIFLLSNIIGLSLINQGAQLYLNQQRENLFIQAQKQAFIIQQKLGKSLFASFALAAAVNQAKGQLSASKFQSLAKELKQQYPEISSFQLAPQGIVSQVYPSDSSLIDRNHLADPKYQWEASLARDSRQPNLAGPFIWGKKGRLALIVHMPIFVDNQFWGFTLTVIWFDDFLSSIGLKKSSGVDYLYQLSFKDHRTNGETIFWQSHEEILINPINISINVPNATRWKLAIAPRQKTLPFWYSYGGRIFVVLVSLAIAGGIYQLFRLPYQLNLKLKEKTQKLEDINLSLEAEIQERQKITQDLKLWKRALTESSNGVVITGIMDDENQVKYPIKFVNHAFTRLTGYHLAEIEGQNCSFLQGEDTSPEALNQLRQALAKGESCNLVLKNYRKDKTPFWNELTISPIRDEEGILTGFLGFQIDVSDRIEAKKALEKEYQKTLLLRQITSDIHQSLDTKTILQTTVDRLGKALKVDRCLIHIYQEEEKEMFCIAEYREENITSMAEVTIPIQNNPHAQQIINNDQAVVANNVFSDPLFNNSLNICVQFDLKSVMAIRTTSQNKINGILAVHQCHYQRDWQPEDIELLESVASQLGIALTQAYLLVRETEKNEELEKARQIAESANQAKSEFLATMSHEIRTPMNAVMGMTSILLDEQLNDQQKQYIKIIRNSGENLLTIINDILDYSKIESGQLILEEYSFELANCLQECLDLLISEASIKGLDILYLIEGNVPDIIVGDETRIKQILVKLVNNAIKFTDQGEIKILVTAKPINKLINAYEIIFQVQDTGIGITSKEQQYLFESFRQVDTSSTRKYRGTGVGLAICQKLVQMMGGSIWVESHGCIAGNPPVDWDESEDRLTTTSNTGSIFAFSIAVKAIYHPLNTTDERDTSWQKYQVNVTQKKDNYLQKTVSSSSHIRLLLVEDNQINQKVISLFLEKYGFRVDLASNGLEALDTLENISYDIILMDVEMPEMDGLTATTIIREKYDSPTVPYIIAITAYAMKGDREKCLAAGMNDYLAKPIKELELITALEKALHTLGLVNLSSPKETNTDTSLKSEDNDIIDHYIIAQMKDLAQEDADDFLSDLVVEYENNARKILSELENAILNNHSTEIQSKSHRLASSSVTVGAIKLSQLCRSLEKSAVSMTNIEIEQIFTQIKQEFQRFLIALKNLV